MICNSGVGLVPTVNGAEHHFSAGGLYNGLVLLIDDETRTYWDHITGRAVHGPLEGEQLEVFGLEMMTTATARRHEPSLRVALSDQPGLHGRVFTRMQSYLPEQNEGFLPPGFRGTMGAPDPRRDEMDMGLGVVLGEHARYYPVERLRAGPVDDAIEGRVLRLELDADGIPFAVWADDRSRPVQLFTRWYGFAYTYSRCTIAPVE